MRQVGLPTNSAFQRLLAVLAFLAYAAALAWHHQAYKSNWRIEQSGALIFASSYLYYGKPLGSVETGLWNFFLQHLNSPDGSADSLLAKAAQRAIPSSGTMATTLDGSGLGYPLFATASLLLFGPHSSSLTLGFLVLLGASVLAFVVRFPDGRLVATPILFLALTLMLFTPLGTAQWWIEQSPIGGMRSFALAGILPALHIVFELLDSANKRPRAWARRSLLALQLIVLLFVIWIRMSAIYFVGAIAFAALLAIWLSRRDAPTRPVLAKVAVLLAVAGCAYLAATSLMPDSYRDAGLTSENFWHRAFIGLGAHPGWPFGNLAAEFDCKAGIPEGLLPGISDRNGHCIYIAAVKEGAEPGPLYGRQYEEAVRRAYWQVVHEYPRQVIETYLLYKPVMIGKTLWESAKLDVSGRSAPLLIALCVQFIILIALLRSSDVRALRSLFAGFVLLAAFSLIPQLFGWSSIATSIDVICYMYVAATLLLAAAVAYSRSVITARASMRSG
jgi:hypothetical protein